MSADTYVPTIRALLLSIVFLLGLCVLFLAGIYSNTAGYGTSLGRFGQVIGGVVAIVALVSLLLNNN